MEAAVVGTEDGRNTPKNREEYESEMLSSHLSLHLVAELHYNVRSSPSTRRSATHSGGVTAVQDQMNTDESWRKLRQKPRRESSREEEPDRG